MEKALQVYTDRELGEIREHGYDGIWLHQKLCDYTPSRIFPEFGRECARYLDVLGKLIQRARRHDLDVYLYLLEPRAIESRDPFWRKHPDLKGQSWKYPNTRQEHLALCSSHPRVKEYLHDSLARLTRQLPGLAGFFAITAGEDFSTCPGKLWERRHFQRILPGHPVGTVETDLTCPRCRTRTIPEIISDLLNLLYDGIVLGNPRCKLLAWDWGWDRLPCRDTEIAIVKRIHPEIIFLSDFEIGGSKTILGKKRPVNEYSLSYAGPSPRFRRHARFAKRTGRRIAAKFQIGTTHELATVPNLPLIPSIYRKVSWARAHGVDAALATWNMGNMRTLNTYAFGQAFKASRPCGQRAFYHGIIRRYLQVSEPELARLMRAWHLFEKAFRHYPYSTPFIYLGPINYAPAYWLKPRPIQGTPTGMSCDARERGDDLGACLGGYSLEEMVAGFEKLIQVWQEGLELYRSVLRNRPNPRLAEEYRSAFCALSVFKSAWHVFRLYRVCRRWNAVKSWNPYRELCALERDNCRSLLPMLREDQRLGFHPECQQYLFNERMLAGKLRLLERYTNHPHSKT